MSFKNSFYVDLFYIFFITATKSFSLRTAESYFFRFVSERRKCQARCGASYLRQVA